MWPSDRAILELSKDAFSENDNLYELQCDALLRALSLRPDSDEWVQVIDQALSWSISSDRLIGISLIYELWCSLYSVEKLNSIVVTALSSPDFWSIANSEDVQKTPRVAILAAYIFSSDLQENSCIGEAIKSFWGISDDRTIKLVIDIISIDGQLGLLWHIGKDKRNVLARKVMVSCYHQELFQSEMGIFNLSYFEDQEFLERLVPSLYRFGAVDLALPVLLSKPGEYSESIFRLLESGLEDAVSTVNDILAKVDTTMWESQIEKGGYLLRCVLYKGVQTDYKFKDAYEAYFGKVMVGHKVQEWVLQNLDLITSKVLDKDVVLAKLTSTYFSSIKDKVDDKVFSSFSIYFAANLPGVDNRELMERVCVWLKTDRWDRLSWFVESVDQQYEGALESLESIISSRVNDCNLSEHKSVIDRLIQIFNLKLSDIS